MSDVANEDSLVQLAVYWAPGPNDEGGQRTYPYDPDEVHCHWEDRPEEVLDKSGNKIVSKSVVTVDRDLEPLGLLMLGALDDIEFPTSPFDNPGVFEIRSFRKVPNVDADEFERIAYL
jgi:hypothetical protein